MEIVTAAQMREIDRETIQDLGIPGAVLVVGDHLDMDSHVQNPPSRPAHRVRGAQGFR